MNVLKKAIPFYLLYTILHGCHYSSLAYGASEYLLYIGAAAQYSMSHAHWWYRTPQCPQMIARKTRSVKMLKWVRGRTVTVHLTTDTAARRQVEHTSGTSHCDCGENYANVDSNSNCLDLLTSLRTVQRHHSAQIRVVRDLTGFNGAYF